ncbi:HAD family hydrolase [Haloimpatiens massiliensis]|uniref:HAD family hydrolase n=1 Tax=Haloimpatiens massiliensis TaxID=1658110 RepID=UPI000C842B3D|nr:HAD family phosphatase [Haloimpatiens massiliensis]
MLKDIKAAIFDMDGTLIDSMWIWSKIDQEYLKKRGIPVPKDLKASIEHLTFEETATYFKNKFNIQDSINQIMDEWNNMAYDEYKFNVTLKPGAKEYLQALKSMNIKIGLATSNNKILLEAALKKNDIYNFFDTICTTDEVNRGKQFPDIYLLTANRLQVNPKHCIVFEDILPAVQGAKSAGMKVVAIHDTFSENQKESLIKEADKYIHTYEELLTVV